MTSSDITTKITLRFEGLEAQLDYFKSAYEDAKAEWLKTAETNPAYAVEWGRNIVFAQGQYEAAYELIGEELTVEAIEKQIERLERKIRMGHGQSTSDLSNGVEYEKWSAAVKVLESLESWRDSLRRLLEGGAA